MFQNKPWISLLGGLLLLAMSLAIRADNQFYLAEIDKHTTNLTTQQLLSEPVKPKVWYYEDKNRDLDILQARNLFEEGKFSAAPYNFNAGYSASRFWFYFQVRALPSFNDLDQIKELYLEIDYPLEDNIVVIQSEEGDIRRVFNVGDRYPFHDRPLDTNNFVLPVSLKLNQTTSFLAYAETGGAVRFPVQFWHKDRFMESNQQTNILNGLFFGLIFILAIYNAFIGLTMKDRAYFFYFGYFVSFGLFLSSYWGYSYQYFWPNSPYLNEVSVPLFGIMSIGSGFFFGRSFLKNGLKNSLLKHLLSFGGLFCFVMIPLCFLLPYRLLVNIAVFSSIPMAIFLFVAGVVSWVQGYTQARFYVAGWTVLLVSLVLFTLANKGIIPINFLTLHANKFGTLFEALFLSMALADRINRISSEKRAVEKQLQENLEQKNVQLETLLKEVQQSSELKDQFLAVISHELRTPMNGLEMSLEVMGDNIKQGEAEEHYLIAKKSAHSMTQIVDRVLELSELQSGKLSIQTVSFKLEELLQNALGACESAAVNKGIQFDLAVSGAPKRFILGDGPRIETILSQLTENAIKFTQQGKVQVKVECHRQNKNDERDTSLEWLLRLSVSDTGIGIQPEQRELIFEKFRQGDGSFTRQHGGLGIGLTLVTALVEKMSGTLDLESTPGVGTTFIVEIPVELGRALPEERENVESQRPPNSSTKASILIVEDNPVNQLMLNTIVKKLGYETTTADNGKEAVEKAEHDLFDCILMDCQMPIMDGYDATRAIRKGKNRDTPIIAVTANTMSADRARCLDNGMNDYIKKPVNKSIIAEKIDQWIAFNRGKEKTSSYPLQG